MPVLLTMLYMTRPFIFSSCLVPYYRSVCCIGMQHWKFLNPQNLVFIGLFQYSDDRISLKDVRRCSRNLFAFGKYFLSPEYRLEVLEPLKILYSLAYFNTLTTEFPSKMYVDVLKTCLLSENISCPQNTEKIGVKYLTVS